jgi:hypothetical protein
VDWRMRGAIRGQLKFFDTLKIDTMSFYEL